MTDYNDGNWHAWEGGECPVHPESLVEVLYVSGEFREGDAKKRDWIGPLLFRVTKEYHEPREFWLVGVHWFVSEYTAKEWRDRNDPDREIIHVREVLK